MKNKKKYYRIDLPIGLFVAGQEEKCEFAINTSSEIRWECSLLSGFEMFPKGDTFYSEWNAEPRLNNGEEVEIYLSENYKIVSVNYSDAFNLEKILSEIEEEKNSDPDGLNDTYPMSFCEMTEKQIEAIFGHDFIV